MLQTIQGIYRNGKIELFESPQDITESPVFVTFVTPKPIKTSSLLISFGMFANHPQSTEADFKGAEFQGDIGNDLDCA